MVENATYWNRRPKISQARVCRVQLKSQRAIPSFSNVLAWAVENASKRWCGREWLDAFSITTKTY